MEGASIGLLSISASEADKLSSSCSQNESASTSLPSSYSRSTLANATKELTIDEVLRAASDEEAEERRKIRRKRGGTLDEESELGRGRPPSYRSTARSPPSDDDGLGSGRYVQQAQMSETRRGKQPARGGLTV